MRNKQDEPITDDRNNIEGDESAAMSPKIDKDSAGVGVDRAEQGAQRVVQTDHKNGRAERLQIFRHETHPQLFARTDHENGDEENDEIAFQPKELAHALKPALRTFA